MVSKLINGLDLSLSILKVIFILLSDSLCRLPSRTPCSFLSFFKSFILLPFLCLLLFSFLTLPLLYAFIYLVPSRLDNLTLGDHLVGYFRCSFQVLYQFQTSDTVQMIRIRPAWYQ